ncbi:hypothetical protein D3C74_322050 [compost metagenome]
MGELSVLPDIDKKKTQVAVEEALKIYRIYKFLTFEEHEVNITTSYNERFHGPTNVTSDSTAQIAIYNADVQAQRKRYCDRIERIVRRMPRMERFLIEERYMTKEHDYITDYNVYTQVFHPPVSEGTYSKVRWRAFYKLAADLNLLVEKAKKQSNKA